MDIQPLFGNNFHKWKDNDEKKYKSQSFSFFLLIHYSAFSAAKAMQH